MPLPIKTNRRVKLFQSRFPKYEIIPASITEVGDAFLALARHRQGKMLVAGADQSEQLPAGFQGTKLDSSDGSYLICKRHHENAEVLRTLLPYMSPKLLGNASSFGFGDRLGNAGPAHLKSLMDSEPFFLPILAQQSIRELDRTGRTAEEVMDAAIWSAFQVGYKDGFGADADHLKTTRDIDRMIPAGFTMFTIDPSDFVDNRSQNMDEEQLHGAFRSLPWDRLNDDPERFLKRYTDHTRDLKGGISFTPSRKDIVRAAVKYGKVIVHTLEMFGYLSDTYSDYHTEVELSVDETPYPTTPEEHLVIASELQRLGVAIVSLAPRFCGDFEKGIDFKGDLDVFRDEYVLHQAIAAEYGGYKLSIHSGSDKFSVYEAIGELDIGNVHVKTAGTSYLEALRAVALCDVSLFREIMTCAVEKFETDRKTYHISADLARLRQPGEYRDNELPMLLDDDNARQVFHVTFGSVLTCESNNGNPGYRERIMGVLSEFEDVYEKCLYNHFRKHIRPFEKRFESNQ